MAKKPKQVQVIFYFNENVSQVCTDALAFYAAIAPANAISPGSPAGAGSAFVSITTAQITAALAHVAACRAAETAATQRTLGTAPGRDTAFAAVLTDIYTFVALVKLVVIATSNTILAKQIVADCGLHTRKEATRTKAPFDVKNDHTTAGDVDFIFKAVPKGDKATYEIQESTDNVNWLTVKTTPNSRSTYPHGKAPGAKLYFRGRVVLSEKKGGAQAWLTPPVAYIFVL